MKKDTSSLRRLEREFLTSVAAMPNGAFTTEAAVKYWSSPSIAYKKLSELTHNGWITRLERSKYLVIPANPSHDWAPDEYVTAQILVQPASLAYSTAARHWNWTEQIPRNLYVQTTARKYTRLKVALGVSFDIVTVPKKKFYGNVSELRNGIRVFVTDKEKTLVDCADDIERAGGPSEFFKVVRHSSNEIDWHKLKQYVQRHPNGAVKKRLGYLFESSGTSLPDKAVEVLGAWRGSLSSGISPLAPYLGSKGLITTRWRLLDNVGINKHE